MHSVSFRTGDSISTKRRERSLRVEIGIQIEKYDKKIHSIRLAFNSCFAKIYGAFLFSKNQFGFHSHIFRNVLFRSFLSLAFLSYCTQKTSFLLNV